MKSTLGRLPLLVGVMIVAPSLALAALQGENLLLPPLPGWAQAYAAAGNGIKLVEYVPPGENVDQRPQFKAKAGEPLALQFILTNTYPHGEKPNVRIRYFVVRETKSKQKTVPDLGDGVVTEGRFTLNYKPKCRVGARQLFTITEPGTYLLRVQTENTDSDHEHFSAIDILVEK